MKVFLPQLCGGSRLSGALREGTRAQAIAAVFLFPCPSATAAASSVVFSFIASIKLHTLNSASSVHKTNTNRGRGEMWGVHGAPGEVAPLFGGFRTYKRCVQTEPYEHTTIL